MKTLEEKQEYYRQYYKANREKILAREREKYIKEHENMSDEDRELERLIHRQYMKDYYENHKDECNARTREYNKKRYEKVKNTEEFKAKRAAYYKEYYKANKDILAAKSKEYHKLNYIPMSELPEDLLALKREIERDRYYAKKEYKGKARDYDGRNKRKAERTTPEDEYIIELYKNYQQYEKGLAKTTVNGAEQRLRYFSNNFLKNHNLYFTTLDFETANSIFVRLVKDKGSIYRNKILTILSGLYKFLLKRDIVKENPVAKLEKLKEPIREREALTPTNQKKLLSILPEYDIRDQMIIFILLNTGCRLNEMINMKMDDIDLDDRFIRVIGKRNKERYIPINDFLYDKLTEFIKYRDDNKIDYTDYVLYTNTRRYNSDENIPISDTRVENILRDMKEKANIRQPLSPHVLRHTFATNLVNKDLDIQIISNILGHDSLDTTMIYAKSNKYRNRDKFININIC